MAADGVGDDEEGHGVGGGADDGGPALERVALGEGPAEGHGDVAEGHDQARDGEGEHAEGVEGGASLDVGADEEVADGDAQDDVDGGGGARELEAVEDGAEGLGGGEGLLDDMDLAAAALNKAFK